MRVARSGLWVPGMGGGGGEGEEGLLFKSDGVVPKETNAGVAQVQTNP